MSFRLKGTLLFIFSAIIMIYGLILRNAPTAATYAEIGTKTTVYMKVDFFYFVYLLFLVPAGFLFDRFPMKKVYFWVILVAALGAIIPAFTNSLIGIGYFFVIAPLAGVFVGSLVLASRWFGHRFFAILVGFAQLIASIGILMGQAPLKTLIASYDLAVVMVSGGIIGCILAILSLFLFSENSLAKPEPYNKESYTKEIRAFFRSSETLWICLYAFMGWGTVVMFGGKWGVPFLKDKYQFSPSQIEFVMTMFWFGFGLLSPLFGWISEKLEKRLSLLRIAAGVGVLCAILLLYVPLATIGNVALLFFIMGAVGAAQLLAFALIKDQTSLNITGLAQGFTNLSIVLGWMIFHPLLALFFKITSGDQTPSLQTMEIGLTLVPILFVLCLLISFFCIKETHCLQKDPS